MPSTAASESTSASLIERAGRLDAEAWRRLTALYGPLVYRWCRRRGLQEADAADVLQEVFRAVATGIAGYHAGESGGFRGWLFGVTRHKLADHFRRRDAEPPALGGGSTPETAAAATAADPADEDESELAVVLHAALDQIESEYDRHNWQAFYRTAINQEAATAVAAELGLTPGAVRQAKFRILRRLRRDLEGCVSEELRPSSDDSFGSFES